MKMLACVVGVAVVAGAMAGCTVEPMPGQTKFLGQVKYDEAFMAARGVLVQNATFVLIRNDDGTVVMWASGDIAVVGVPGVSFTGTASARNGWSSAGHVPRATLMPAVASPSPSTNP